MPDELKLNPQDMTDFQLQEDDDDTGDGDAYFDEDVDLDDLKLDFLSK